METHMLHRKLLVGIANIRIFKPDRFDLSASTHCYTALWVMIYV